MLIQFAFQAAAGSKKGMRRYVEQIVVLRSPQVFEGVNPLCRGKRIQNEHVPPLNGLFNTGDEKEPVIFGAAPQIGIVGESVVIRNGNGFETLLGRLLNELVGSMFNMVFSIVASVNVKIGLECIHAELTLLLPSPFYLFSVNSEKFCTRSNYENIRYLFPNH